MVNLTAFLIIFITIGFNFVQCRDLINFNVYQTGDRIHGHYKLPTNNVKINFEVNRVNVSYSTFNVASLSPDPFELSGEIFKIFDRSRSAAITKVRASSNSANVSFDDTLSPLSMTGDDGAKLEINFNLNASNIKVKYQYYLERRKGYWPCNLIHNLTTEPADLLTFTSNVTGYCEACNLTTKDVKLNGLLRSTKWSHLNSTILQRWSFNSTGGDEEMTFDNPSVGSMLVTNNWNNSPHPMTNKTAFFTSRNKYLPSFRLHYLAHGEKKVFKYVPVDENGFSND